MEWNNLNEKIILIAEDDMFNRQLIVSFLAKYKNIKIIKAENGIETLDNLSKFHVDLCLLDLYMPKMNGFDTLRHIRKNNNHMPIIAISSDELEKQKSLDLGANEFIAKPFKLKNLESIIYNILKNVH